MIKHPDTIEFATILTAAVHDMKNSLQLQLQKLEQVAAQVENTDAAQSLADIHYEAQRLNASLIQLLSLYRHEDGRFPLQLEIQLIDELIEDVIADSEFYAHHYGIQIHVDVTHHLSWYLDKNLISILLQDVIINAVRYANRTVTIRAYEQHEWLVIEVQDDGAGYPTQVLESINQGQYGQGQTSLSSGRTGLGLYFARRIAESHQRHQRCGEIALSNCKGGNFILRLP